MNLTDVWVPPDADDATVWAAQHELALRRKRYDFYASGGMAGVLKRTAEAMTRIAKGLEGWVTEEDAQTLVDHGPEATVRG